MMGLRCGLEENPEPALPVVAALPQAADIGQPSGWGSPGPAKVDNRLENVIDEQKMHVLTIINFILTEISNFLMLHSKYSVAVAHTQVNLKPAFKRRL